MENKVTRPYDNHLPTSVFDAAPSGRAITTAEAANYTGLAAATLEKLRCSGGGPRFVRYSRRAVRYRVPELDAWMGARTVASTSEKARV